MSREQLQRLVRDAEAQPLLRAQLRGVCDWGELSLRASALGYAVSRADLSQANQEDAAGRFLEQARIEPVRDLLGSVPGRHAQLSWRRLASTAR